MRFSTVPPPPSDPLGIVTLKEPTGSAGLVELHLNGYTVGVFSGNTFKVSKSRINAAGLVLTMGDNPRGGDVIL